MRLYAYVGRSDTLELCEGQPMGVAIREADDLAAALAGAVERTFTFVVAEDGTLRLADRRSEHVACAGGRRVLAAGELTVSTDPLSITEATNQSTGYCPEPDCWTALLATLVPLGLPHPSTWTRAYTFRRCPACDSRCLIKDDHWHCACGTRLPTHWNF